MTFRSGGRGNWRQGHQCSYMRPGGGENQR